MTVQKTQSLLFSLLCFAFVVVMALVTAISNA